MLIVWAQHLRSSRSSETLAVSLHRCGADYRESSLRSAEAHHLSLVQLQVLQLHLEEVGQVQLLMRLHGLLLELRDGKTRLRVPRVLTLRTSAHYGVELVTEENSPLLASGVHNIPV